MSHASYPIDHVFVHSLPEATQAGTISRSSVNSSATSVTLIAANTARRGLTIVNTDANDLYVKFEAGATSTTDFDYIVPSGGTLEMFGDTIYGGEIRGIWAADGSGIARITEYA